MSQLSDPDYEFFRKEIIKLVEDVAETGRADEDMPHWIMEIAINCIYGTGFWGWYQRRLNSSI